MATAPGELDGSAAASSPPSTTPEAADRQRKPQAESSGLARWLGDDKALLNALGLTGLAAYAYLRLAYVFFYRQVGLVPEDVGLGYFEVLSQSLVGFLVLLAAFFVTALFILACLSITVGLMIGTGQSAGSIFATLRHTSVPARLVLIAIGVILVVAAFVPRWELAQAALGFIVYGGVCTALTRLTERKANAIETLWTWGPRVALAFVLLASLSLGPFVYLKQAEADGAAVRDRGAARHPTLFGTIPLANWGADPALVLWQRDSLPDGWATRVSDCLVYLGRSGDTNVLFDVTTKDVVRVPTRAATIVATTSDEASCDARGAGASQEARMPGEFPPGSALL